MLAGSRRFAPTLAVALLAFASAACGPTGDGSSEDEATRLDDGSSGAAGEDDSATGGLDGDDVEEKDPACTYPTEGRFGVSENEILDAHLRWQGFVEHGGDARSIEIGAYHDCDGSKGIDVLLLITAEITCAPCQEEAKQLEDLIRGPWGELGVHVITLVLDDGLGEGLENATKWKETYGLDSSAVVTDPEASMGEGGVVLATPLHVLVDPRTMRVVDRREGYSEDYPELLELAEKNRN